MENNRNFFITIALSVLILTLWQVFYMNPKIETERETARIEQERVAAEQEGGRAGRNARCGSGAAPAQHSWRTRDAGCRGEPRPGNCRLEPRRYRYAEPQGLDQPDRRTHRRHQPQALPRHGRPELADHRIAEPAVAAVGLLQRDRLCRQRRSTGAVPGPETVWTVEGNQTADADHARHAHLCQRQGLDLQAQPSRSTRTTCSRLPTR